MKYNIIIFLLLPLISISQVNIQCIEGDKTLSFLRNKLSIKVEFDYSNLTYDSIKDFQKFLVTRKDQKEVFHTGHTGVAYVEDGNNAYVRVPLRPKKRIVGEKAFLENLNKYTLPFGSYFSANVSIYEYKMVIVFNDVVTFYQRGFDNPKVDLKLKNLQIKFIDNRTQMVKAILINTDYEKKWQDFTYEKMAADFGEYIRKQMKDP